MKSENELRKQLVELHTEVIKQSHSILDTVKRATEIPDANERARLLQVASEEQKHLSLMQDRFNFLQSKLPQLEGPKPPSIDLDYLSHAPPGLETIAPSIPTGLKAIPLSETQIQLAWNIALITWA